MIEGERVYFGGHERRDVRMGKEDREARGGVLRSNRASHDPLRPTTTKHEIPTEDSLSTRLVFIQPIAHVLVSYFFYTLCTSPSTQKRRIQNWDSYNIKGIIAASGITKGR